MKLKISQPKGQIPGKQEIPERPKPNTKSNCDLVNLELLQFSRL